MFAGKYDLFRIDDNYTRNISRSSSIKIRPTQLDPQLSRSKNINSQERHLLGSLTNI